MGDTVLLEESARGLQRAVQEFYKVCLRRKLRLNVGKSKVIVLERKVEVCDFIMPYRVSVPAVVGCEMPLGGERMKEVDEFKYLGQFCPSMENSTVDNSGHIPPTYLPSDSLMPVIKILYNVFHALWPKPTKS